MYCSKYTNNGMAWVRWERECIGAEKSGEGRRRVEKGGEGWRRAEKSGEGRAAL